MRWYVIGEEYACDGIYLDVILGSFPNKASAVDYLLMDVDNAIYPHSYVIPQHVYDKDDEEVDL